MRSATLTPLPKTFLRSAILWGGLACGILDIAAAFLQWQARGVMPVRVLQGIAGALLGKRAGDGGLATAALGLAMHFAIAFAFAALFACACRRFPVLLRRTIVAGLVYGALAYLVMTRVMLPLTTGIRRLYLDGVVFTWPQLTWQGLAIHLGCVGLPIAVAARFAAQRNPTGAASTAVPS